MDCIFCKIACGEIKADIEYQDDKIVIFHDLNPQAPVHLLAIPKDHIQSLDHINESNCNAVSHIFKHLPKIAKKFGIENGYRLVSNCGEKAGQTVNHLHFHILGGRDMRWPPG
ncbi:MAG: histidine triad nucleotide-binding protein [Oscillospiraceae bacterium]|jgi:histidine triad (HIT) family protein|nr:histidine triad nucleotide-binding protein [Oscillospiraceae bacterium]